jgi:adenylate cyclase
MLRLGIRGRVLAQAADQGLEHSDLGWLILYILRRQVAAAAARRPDLDRTDAVEVTVGFVDLVGFTSAVAQASDDELTKLITSFQALAFDAIAESGGRAVKLIGDEVMYVADDPVEAVRVATRLREDAQAAGLSDTRAGIALGHVVAYGGDYYGPVVNRASRLTTAAGPGQVLIDRTTHDAIQRSPSFSVTSHRTLVLKGLGPTEAWAAASRDADVPMATPAASPEVNPRRSAE